MLYLRYIFDCHIKYSLSFHWLHIPLCFQDGMSCSYFTNFLCFIICLSSLCSYFSVTVTQTLQSSYGISWRLVNLSPCQWDNYDYPHFTGWEAEKEIWQNVLSGRKMLVCMQSYHSRFCISSCIYTLAHLHTQQFAEAEGVCMCLGGILS